MPDKPAIKVIIINKPTGEKRREMTKELVDFLAKTWHMAVNKNK